MNTTIPLKRKRKVVTLQEKYEAIKKVDKGLSIVSVAAELGVGQVTVGDWVRNRNKIENFVLQTQGKSGDGKRKSLKMGEFPKTAEALFVWFVQKREQGCPISGPILQAKALDFYNAFRDGESFTASAGWLNRWKTRFGVRQLQISGEKLSSNTEGADSFILELDELIRSEQLSYQQIYNCDETGLNFRMLPEKTLASREEQNAPGYKRSKERITVLACVNKSGDNKLDLFVLGKSKKPRAFKNLNMQNLPVIYGNQKNAWMTCVLFKNWFHQTFVPSVKRFSDENNLPHKAILLLDNAPCHPDDSELIDGDIKAVYLPYNVTALIQPLDQGILELLKRNYRRLLVTTLLGDVDNGMTITQSLKKITLKDVIYWLKDAWDWINPETITKCWKKISRGMDIENDQEQTDDLLDLLYLVPAESEITADDVNLWMDDDISYDDTAIIEFVHLNSSNLAPENNSDDQEVDIEPPIKHADGLLAIQNAIRYAEQQEETSMNDILVLRRLEKQALNRRASSLKQRPITLFITK